eukprot:gene17171-biopygen17722
MRGHKISTLPATGGGVVSDGSTPKYLARDWRRRGRHGKTRLHTARKERAVNRKKGVVPRCLRARARHTADSGTRRSYIYVDVVWRQHGAPMKIVCDRDPRFQDAFWKELIIRLMGVRVVSTTPYNPRSDDGQAAQTNRVVEDMLRPFQGSSPKRWHGPVLVVERFYSDLQSELPEADRGAPVTYRLTLPHHWRIHDVFAQHRLKPHVRQGSEAFASRKQVPNQ